MAGPAIIFVAAAAALGRYSDLAAGWAIPCATDIAFSYMVALVVFGRRHPATAQEMDRSEAGDARD